MASVRSKNNALVANLEKTDFHILEDGKEQEIRYFSRESDLPPHHRYADRRQR